MGLNFQNAMRLITKGHGFEHTGSSSQKLKIFREYPEGKNIHRVLSSNPSKVMNSVPGVTNSNTLRIPQRSLILFSAIMDSNALGFDSLEDYGFESPKGTNTHTVIKCTTLRVALDKMLEKVCDR